MVRVFSIYQFNGQSIHRIPDDIRSANLIDANHLALAKSDHVIEIVSLRNSQFDESNRARLIRHHSTDDNNIHIKYAFPTVDEVIDMVYCEFGNFIATVECKTSSGGVEHSFCRVYTNWENCKTATNDSTDDINFMSCNVTIRARIAGRVTPSTNNFNCLEVIEIPTIVRCWCGQIQSSQSYKLAVCQRTGTIVVCAKDRFLKFYKFDECVNENTHFKYIDFMEIPFEVELDFIPTQLSITEHIVGCSNSEYMCIFKIIEQNYFNTANSLTTSSSLSVMATIPICPYVDSTIDSVLDYQKLSKQFLSSITTNISSTFDYQSKETNNEKIRMCRDRSIELKPKCIDTGILLCNLRHFAATNDDDIYKDYVLRILVQVKQHDANDPFQCLVLSPIYSRKQRELDTTNVFRSHSGSAFIGISVLLATVNEGYLYQFSNNEKWTINETDVQTSSLIATYSFTSPIITVCVTDYVIHALTDHGIETYTHCIGHKIFNNIYEYSLSDNLCNAETLPRVEEQICLIGLRPFLGIQRMFNTSDNLILLARSQNSPSNEIQSKLKSKEKAHIETNWTVYNLKMSSAAILYKDFIELAGNHKIGLTELITSQNSDKVRIYTLLLTEGHVILRIAKEIYIGQTNEFKITYAKNIDRLFIDSCYQLADFYVMSQNRDQYCLAYPYYVMGNLKLDHVYNRIIAIIGDIPQNSKTMIGTVHTLKTMILKSTERNEEFSRRLTSTLESNRTFGEKLLEFFAKYAPSELAVIGLNSITFRDTMSTKMCEIILNLQNNGRDLSNEDKLILILDAIRCDRKDEALKYLVSFNAMDLYRLLTSNWTILFETTKVKRTGKTITTFSEMTESYLLPASITSSSIHSALLATFRNLLIDTNVLNIELILKLLMDFLASNFGQISLYLSVQSILENLLEAYFHRLYVIRRYSDTLSSASEEMLTKNATEFNSKSGNNNDSLGSTSSDNVTTSIGFNSNNSVQKMNDSTQSDMNGSSTIEANDSIARKHSQNLFSSSFNVEALKILIRIYLSALKAHTVDLDVKTKEKATYVKYVKCLRENFNRVYVHHISQNTNCDGRSSTIDETKYCTDDTKNEIQLTKIPILFLMQRPAYLNAMPPIGECNQKKYETRADNGFETNEKERKAIGIVLKLQSLLSSGILTRDILQEVLHFTESNIPFFGVDSFLTLLMPFEMCVDFLIEMCPEYLLEYAKCASIDEQKWQYVLTQITIHFDRITQNRSQEFYEALLKDHLDYLVHTKRLPEILNIIPIKYFGEDVVQMMSKTQEKIDNGSNIETSDLFPEYNNNNALFKNFLKLAIDMDRSERLNEMIKTTGFQLYNTFIGGNHPDAIRSAAEN